MVPGHTSTELIEMVKYIEFQIWCWEAPPEPFTKPKVMRRR